MRIALIILTSVLLMTSEVLASGEGESYAPKKGTIEGKVIEPSEKIPVEFANIVLFSVKDSAMVTGGITGPEGNFLLEDIPMGVYYMTVNFIGYEKKTIENIRITEDNRRINIGTIGLGITAVMLEGAKVVSEKMAVEYKLDRKVINVDQDLSSAGSSAVDVLQKAPSVRVDIEGNVSLRGSSNFVVLIDGKPSVLTGSEALQQIPASAIENIEIITNPSAKYDPDGTSGIINIVMKKERMKGFSAMIDGTVGTGDKYASDVYLNYKNKKFNVFGSIEWNDRRFPREGEEYREVYSEDTIFFRQSSNSGAWSRNGINLKGGVDYYLDSKATFSLGGEYGNYGFGWDNFRKVQEYTSPSGNNRYYLDNNSFTWKRNYYSINANYQQKFRQEGHQLNIFAYFSSRDGSQKQDKRETDTDENFNTIGTEPFLLRSVEEGPSSRFRTEIDYQKPVFENGKIEAGYHFRHFKDEESYMVENYDFDFSEWLVDDNYSKLSIFDRNIHAVYGIFSNIFKNFEYQVGIRGEYTYRNIEVANTGENSLVDRFDYFPSVHISQKILEKNQLMASYSRRIDRPRSWYLEPFETYVDESTRRVGNPSLLPEYTDSYELGYLRTLKAGTISLETYYRKTNNKITSVQYFDEASGLIYRNFVNLNNDQSLGTELSTMYDVTKWLNINVSGTYYFYQVEDLTGETTDMRKSNNWDARLITTFKLPTKTSIQINYSYQSPTVTAQGRSEGYHYSDVTLRQDFFDKQLSATLKVGDVFASRKRESYTQSQNLYIYEKRIPESRVVTLTVSYRFNNFRKHEQRMINESNGIGM